MTLGFILGAIVLCVGVLLGVVIVQTTQNYFLNSGKDEDKTAKSSYDI